MPPLSIREFRRNLSDTVDAAQRGRSTQISRHGKVVAELGPAQADLAGGLPELTAFRRSIKAAKRGAGLSRQIVEQRRLARY